MRWPFLASGSGIPLMGRSVKLITPWRLKTGRLVFIGAGVFFDAHARDGVVLGDGVSIREGGVVQCRSGLNEPGLGLSIGDRTFIGPYCKIGVGGRVTIGRNVQMGYGVSINAESHESDGNSYAGGKVSRKGVVIEDDVWIGDHVTILDGVTIGRGSVVGAGSVVTRSVRPGVIVAGVPAKLLREQ